MLEIFFILLLLDIIILNSIISVSYTHLIRVFSLQALVLEPNSASFPFVNTNMVMVGENSPFIRNMR